MEPKESKILLDHEICRGLIYQTHLLFLGSGLVFCLSQKSHTNTLGFHGANEGNTDICYLYYLQDEILPRSPARL